MHENTILWGQICPFLIIKKELKSQLGIINILGKFSHLSTGVCEPLQRVIQKMWLDLEQHIPKPTWKSQKTHKKNMTMGFYSEK